MLPPIKGFIPNTLIDWEGRIASIIFLPGCNLRCPYCHAGHLVGAPNTLESIPFDSLEEKARSQRGWLDGVVISGGEPTLHNTLAELCERIRSLGLGVKLDTNGTRPDHLRFLIEKGLVDCVSMDVKAPLDKYPQATRADCDVAAVRESITMLLDGDLEYEFRMTVCPAVSTEEDVMNTAKEIRGARVFYLQQFNPEFAMDPSLRDVRPYPREQLREFAQKASRFVNLCVVRGEPLPVAAD
ncbi:MAG: anaerobic ribonucleoside-triphosphate reductase activating protein [Planctomycetota bacterium]